MRTFAEKPNATRQGTLTRSRKLSRTHVGQCLEVNSILHNWRTQTNQAAQVLGTDTIELEIGADHIEQPRHSCRCNPLSRHSEAVDTSQLKVTIGAPNDRYEREADRVAEQILHLPGPEAPRGPISSPNQARDKMRLHAEPVASNITPLRNEQLETKESKATGHRGPFKLESEPAFSAVSFRGRGQPLPESVRTWFEPRFGYDFSRVRVHTDTRARDTAQKLNARAFTLGWDIVLGAGAYAPASEEGRRLLAHELTHVVQQQQAFTAFRPETAETCNTSGCENHIQRMVTRLPPRGRGSIAPAAPTLALSGMQCILNRYGLVRALLPLPVSSCKQASGPGFTINLLGSGIRGGQLFLKGGSWLDIVNLDNTAHAVIWVTSVRPPTRSKPGGPKSKTGTGPAGRSTVPRSQPKSGATPSSTAPRSMPPPLSLYHVPRCTILRIHIAAVPRPQTGWILDYQTRTRRRWTICP
jgi:hypothetical protein